MTETALQRLVVSAVTAMIVPIQLASAAGMRWQARGDVERADEEFDQAARELPRLYHHVARGRCYAVLPPAPRTEAPIDALVWRTARVVLREQAGLAEHRARLVRGRLAPREVVVVAYIEQMRWVDCDNFVLSAGVDVTGVVFEARSPVLARRATNLCRFADPTAGEITTALWRGMGGERGVRAAALAELATWPLVPTHGPGALPPDAPVRRARVEAHRRALGYRDDLSA